MLQTILIVKEEKNPVLVDGLTVIHLAARLGHFKIMKWYKDKLNFDNIKLNPKDNNGHTPLSWAISQQKLNIVDYFIDLGYDATGKNSNLFPSGTKSP